MMSAVGALTIGFLLMLVVIGFGVLSGSGEAGYETGGEIGADTIDSDSGYDMETTYMQICSTVVVVGDVNGDESV